MAVTYPYPLAFLSDLLCTRDGVLLDLQRNDQASGTGDGRVWTAQLARPLWTVSLSFAAKSRAVAREVDAKIRALDGSRQAFLWADKFYRPASGTNPGAGVTISSISTDRTRIGLTGITPGHRISAGDRCSISWGAGREFLGEFAETVVSGSGGNAGNLTITPWLPQGIAIGAGVEMIAPRLKVFVPPGGHVPFSARPGRWSLGGSLTLLQRI